MTVLRTGSLCKYINGAAKTYSNAFYLKGGATLFRGNVLGPSLQQFPKDLFLAHVTSYKYVYGDGCTKIYLLRNVYAYNITSFVCGKFKIFL